MTHPAAPRPSGGAEDPRIRRSWLIFATAFFALGTISAMRLFGGGTRPVDLAVTGLIVVVGFAAVRHRIAVQRLEEGRWTEAESFARILQGLSRSISPDAIVGAIVDELGAGTGADHVVIVRRRPESPVLEATLVNARTGGSTSSTLFPISDLEDPPTDPGRGHREPVGIAIAVPVDRAAPPPPLAVARSPRIATVVAPPGGDARIPAAFRSGRRSPTARPVAILRAAAAVGAPGASDQTRRVADRIAARARDVFGLRYTLSAPLTTDRGQIGALVISRRTAGRWTDAAERVLNGAAIEASAALERAYSHQQAEARASTDGLTGLPNRRYFDEFCALLARRRRAEDSVGVLMIDIDRFKTLNDAYGHLVGDDVLRAVAGAIAAAVREDDVPARYGGEEFAVLLRNPSRDVAIEVAERVRRAVGHLDLGSIGVPAVSVSVGAAVATAPNQPIGKIVEQADRALYAAKRGGRDQVVAA